jgi:hypothetical protein
MTASTSPTSSGSSAEVIGNPKEERTRTFLRRVLDPTHVDVLDDHLTR